MDGEWAIDARFTNRGGFGILKGRFGFVHLGKIA